MDVRKRVGFNVQRLRRGRRLSQEELAHRADVHQTYLSGRRGGQAEPLDWRLGTDRKGAGRRYRGAFSSTSSRTAIGALRVKTLPTASARRWGPPGSGSRADRVRSFRG